MDRNTTFKDGELFGAPVAGATEIWGGHMIAVNAAGYAVPASAVAASTVIGVSDGWVDNGQGANGDTVALVRRGKFWLLGNSGTDPVTQAQMGKDCYVFDSQTVAKTSDTNARPVAGKVMGLAADGVWVLI